MAKSALSPYVNWGRWLVKCPRCGIATMLEPEQKTFACANCYPGLLARAIQMFPDSLGRPVPDRLTMEQAYEQAAKADEVYGVDWPDNQAEVEDTLRGRPVEAMNWTPEVQIAELQEENAARGIL